MRDEKADASKKSEIEHSGVDATKAAPEASGANRAEEETDSSGSKTNVEPKVTVGTSQPAETSLPAKRKLSFQKVVPVLVLLFAAGILLAITGGWNRWVGGRSEQKTDDAYLRGNITPLSTKVSGTVVQVAVADHQHVKAGDLLIQLKDEDFKAQVSQADTGVVGARAAMENNAKQKEMQTSRITQAQAGLDGANAELGQAGAAIEAARADVENAQAGVDAAQAKIPDAQASIEAAQADAQKTLLERKRQEALIELASATKQKLERVVADQERFGAVLNSRKAELAQIRALLESRRADLSKARAQVAMRQAEQQRARARISSRTAELDALVKQRAVLGAQEQELLAELSLKQDALTVAQTNLDHTRILAPTDGIVGECKVRTGQLVSPGTQVITLVEDTIWVQANYKER